MTDFSVAEQDVAERRVTADGIQPRRPRRKSWGAVVVVGALVVLAAIIGGREWHGSAPSAAPPPAPPRVTVSAPLQQTVSSTTGFLGQFSAVETVELRAQVGGTLTGILFQDGQIVHKGDPLFVIDPRPFQIRLEQAVAQLQAAQARKALAEAELWRAQQLKRTEFGTTENVDQRAAEARGAQAAIDTASAAIRDAQLDLEFSRIVAPFTGRIGAHLVSVGNLISGSRAGTSATTLLATIVSIDPAHLDFDMSEADYLAYQRNRNGAAQPDKVTVDLGGEGHFDRQGVLDFIDNAVNRGSGTIHARATVANPDFAITPGQFARLRVAIGAPAPALLIPAAAIVPDQSREIVLTVGADGTVVPKAVETADLYHGLRVIRGGLGPTDAVVIDGLVRAHPGAKVTPVAGTISAATDRDDR